MADIAGAPLSREAEQVLKRLGVDSMSGYQFEEFVGELFRLTGFEVEAPGGPGDLGADLIVGHGNRRLSVQLKRYSAGKNASRRAVSDAIGPMRHYDCTDALAVTNRTFTESAREFAQGRCYLIGRDLLSRWAADYEGRISSGDLRLAGITGSEFEELVAEALRGAGYEVSEIGGSGDFGADLIISDEGRRIAAQLKRKEDRVSRRAVSDAVGAEEYYDCAASWVITSAPGYTAGARRLAKSNETRLVGPETVSEWLNAAGETGEEPSLGTPDDLLETLEWNLQLFGGEIGDLDIDFERGQIATLFSAVFYGHIKGAGRIRYRNMPEGSWLLFKFPQHRLFRWEPVSDQAKYHGSVGAFPLSEGQGYVRFNLFVSKPSGTGWESASNQLDRLVQRKITNTELVGQIANGEPDRDQMLSLHNSIR